MIQRVYIDTSVIGGVFDEEFKFFTKIFFERVFKGEIRLMVSDLLEGELVTAPRMGIGILSVVAKRTNGVHQRHQGE